MVEGREMGLAVSEQVSFCGGDGAGIDGVVGGEDDAVVRDDGGFFVEEEIEEALVVEFEDGLVLVEEGVDVVVEDERGRHGGEVEQHVVGGEDGVVVGKGVFDAIRAGEFGVERVLAVRTDGFAVGSGEEDGGGREGHGEEGSDWFLDDGVGVQEQEFGVDAKRGIHEHLDFGVLEQGTDALAVGGRRDVRAVGFDETCRVIGAQGALVVVGADDQEVALPLSVASDRAEEGGATVDVRRAEEGDDRVLGSGDGVDECPEL